MPNPEARRAAGATNAFGIVTDGEGPDAAIISGGVEQHFTEPNADGVGGDGDGGDGGDGPRRVDSGDTNVGGDGGGDQPSAELVRAREQASTKGWKPLDQWVADGKPESRWRDAPEFLDVHNGILSVVREENSGLRSELAAVKAILKARDNKEKHDLNQISLATLRTQRREAMRTEDWDAVDALDTKILDATLAEREGRRTGTTEPIDPVIQEQFDQITSRYPWMQQGKPTFDPVMVNRLLGEIKLIVDTPGNPFGPIQAVHEGLDRIRRRYPEKFKAAPRRNGNGSSMVDMGGTSGVNGGGNNGRTWNDLLPENRRTAEADIARGVYTKAQYLALCQPEDFRH